MVYIKKGGLKKITHGFPSLLRGEKSKDLKG